MRVFFISNGESWSDFQVWGAVIAEDNELPTLEAILRYAAEELQEMYTENQKAYDKWIATGNSFKNFKPLDISEEAVLQKRFADHGYIFTPYNEDLVLP